MSLNDYAVTQLTSGLQTFDDYGLSAYIDISADLRSGSQAVLKAKVLFVDATELYIRIFYLGGMANQLLSYAYQYQQSDGTLIFRYDNARHKPDLGFECHKHQADGRIVAAEPPMIRALVEEIIDHITCQERN
ncbi:MULTISPECIES: DUF6516 family protein [Cyanophyceae]|uniref:toxin-antitoxin system TumE family protein n=1 Tax=Cyanophyceae TaxID=3028117 RepID=UPI001683DC66|nr:MULTISPECIES: DUF6516 family protein [Cyanophyceae]MBD1915753.1 hypothetical protein [Phormidium sp. FACHB-77]MBD2030060.1 hypothetical protein [Phormidium sp. FACHB-322]MBD2052172.1 hypothetical protein [Leptolyngbya sp. FACHB-60]